ncbi:MAG: glycine cleavage system protein GcvH [Thermodesulfobacteriota bacterium]
MKEISELVLPEYVRYAKDHEWVRPLNGRVKIGVSDYAQDQLGDITFVELPETGDVFEAGEEFGTLESTKAVGELFMPLAGEVTAVNKALLDEPGLVNRDPYGEGWLVELEPEDPEAVEEMMNREEYLDMLERMV